MASCSCVQTTPGAAGVQEYPPADWPGFPAIIRTLWPTKIAAEFVSHLRHTLLTGEHHYSPEFSERRRDTGVTEFCVG